MRSRNIVRYYMNLTVTTPNATDTTQDQVTGVLYAVTDQNNEIPVYQSDSPVARQNFLDAAATLETALNEVWYQLPAEISDDSN